MIQLFELENNVVKPTVHCRMIKQFKAIQEKWPEDFLKRYAYVFYMTCPSKESPYCNMKDTVKHNKLVIDLDVDFSTEDDEIIDAIEKAKELYETPTLRAYKNIVTMLDNIGTHIATTAVVSAGKDANIGSFIRVAEKFDTIRLSFKGTAKDLEAEQEAVRARGSSELAYDQQ